ncbi:MAG: translation initiation factor IF-2 subunit beta [Candidatus ainarchaeum sp.]|nr:translation initiation factor IF-2 subunit beta [Candidatus ainarchaeum sp.]
MDDYEKLLDNIYNNLPKGTVGDQRFEFPEFDSLIEGNKTFIKNIDAVASKLRREKQFIIKFLSKELATPVVSEGDRIVLQRKVSPNVLKGKLEEFIKDYVVCRVCGKPDTHIRTMGAVKEVVCEACGARRPAK